MLIDSVLYLWHAEVAGSIPARSISLAAASTAGLAQLVEHQAFNLVVAGSTPAVGTSAFLALVVEHLSCKEKALGSNPRGGIFLMDF